jgi:hypothetical protein
MGVTEEIVKLTKTSIIGLAWMHEDEAKIGPMGAIENLPEKAMIEGTSKQIGVIEAMLYKMEGGYYRVVFVNGVPFTREINMMLYLISELANGRRKTYEVALYRFTEDESEAA